MAECFREPARRPDQVEGEAMALPSDVPEDVLEACGLTMSTSGSTDR